MFGSIGVPEIVLIFVVALLLFGPRKLPEIGRTIGKALGEFRRASNDLKRTIEEEVATDELRQVGRDLREATSSPISLSDLSGAGSAGRPARDAAPVSGDEPGDATAVADMPEPALEEAPDSSDGSAGQASDAATGSDGSQGEQAAATEEERV